MVKTVVNKEKLSVKVSSQCSKTGQQAPAHGVSLEKSTNKEAPAFNVSSEQAINMKTGRTQTVKTKNVEKSLVKESRQCSSEFQA
jgi:hypothetical protein